MRAGHAVADTSGRLVGVDEELAGILHGESGALIGRTVLDVTAPADRAECSACIARLVAERRPFEITKRLLRDDGTLVWVVNSVSLVGGGAGELIVATIEPLAEPAEDRAPARLLDSARMLESFRSDRAALFDPALLSVTGWGAVLAAYIAEAEGRAVTVPMLAERLRVSQAQADRWIAALTRGGIVEIETRDPDAYAPKSFRLTGEAHRRLEAHLARAGTRLENRARADVL